MGVQRHREVHEAMENAEKEGEPNPYPTRDAYFDALNQRPESWEIWVKHLDEDQKPPGWCNDVHGIYPANGRCTGCRRKSEASKTWNQSVYKEVNVRVLVLSA